MESYRQSLQLQLQNFNRPSLTIYWSKVYSYIKNDLSKQMKILEVGAGSGISRNFLADFQIVRTDMHEFPERNVVGGINAQNLPFKDQQFDVLFGVDALHHFASPTTALREAKRVVNFDAGGKLLFIEPYVSLFSFPIYKLFHYERTSFPWKTTFAEPFTNDSSIDGDQALSHILFMKKSGREILNTIFPKQLFKIDLLPFSFLDFFLTGGVANPLPTPVRIIKQAMIMERLIPKGVQKYLGARILIVISRRV